jgi:hypothetical protein
VRACVERGGEVLSGICASRRLRRHLGPPPTIAHSAGRLARSEGHACKGPAATRGKRAQWTLADVLTGASFAGNAQRVAVQRPVSAPRHWQAARTSAHPAHPAHPAPCPPRQPQHMMTPVDDCFLDSACRCNAHGERCHGAPHRSNNGAPSSVTSSRAARRPASATAAMSVADLTSPRHPPGV